MEIEYTEEEKIIMRAITWLDEDASDGSKEAQEIIEGLKEIGKSFAMPVVSGSLPSFKTRNNVMHDLCTIEGDLIDEDKIKLLWIYDKWLVNNAGLPEGNEL